MDKFYQKCYLHNVNILSSIFRNEHFVCKVEYLIVKRITSTIEIIFLNQNLMCHPPAATNARHFLDKELIRRYIITCGMFHIYACNVASSCRRYRPTQLVPYNVQIEHRVKTSDMQAC